MELFDRIVSWLGIFSGSYLLGHQYGFYTGAAALGLAGGIVGLSNIGSKKNVG